MGQLLCINNNYEDNINDNKDKLETMENIVEINNGSCYLNSTADFLFLKNNINIGQPFIIEYCSDNKYSNDLLAYYGVFSHIKEDKSKIIQIYSSIPFMMYNKEEKSKNIFNHNIKKVNINKAPLGPWNYYLNVYNIYTGNKATNKWDEYEFLSFI